MKHQYHPREIWTRAQQVGGLSLFALLVGGSVLHLFSINVWASKDTYRRETTGPIKATTVAVFRVGSELGIQFWLAVLGVAFGLLSYGMKTTYIHMFDCWSTSKANRSPGLNYARYLNSQPHSPVMFGFRGFPAAILIRNLIIALGMVCSVGYNFAVIEVAVDTYFQPLDVNRVNLSVPPISGFLQGGGGRVASPWLGDGPGLTTNRAFLHQQRIIYNTSLQAEKALKAEKALSRPPEMIVMAGWAECADLFNLLDKGVLFTREIVMVARRIDGAAASSNDPVMTADPVDWLRLENASTRWTATGAQAVIDYRIPLPSQVDIQWAEMGSWLRDSSKQQTVIRRLSYEVHLAVAIVRRFVSGPDCSGIYDGDGEMLAAQIVVESRIPVITENYREALLVNRHWISSILLHHDAGPPEGVSGLLRSVMAYWAATQSRGQSQALLGHAPAILPPRPTTSSEAGTPEVPESWWFNEEAYNASTRVKISSPLFIYPEVLNNAATTAARGREISAAYPAYAGTRVTGQTGSYHVVMYLFIIIGVFAYGVVGARMYLGPAELTSWMGQHVYLAGLGGKIPREATEHLAGGHHVAEETQLGMLRVKANEPLTRRELLVASMVERFYHEDPLNSSMYIGRMLNGY